MAFQYGTSAASGAYRDILVDLQAFATSKHISAVAINAAGTGYVVGDILTISHAGGYLDAKLEVLTVGGGGDITSVAIRAAGAFSNRVATVAVNAGGTGYAVNDIVRLTTGTFTEFCKVKVTTVSTGVATAVAVFETGGAYSSVPTATGGATSSDIGTGSGTGLTINTTMTGLIGTSGIAATGGTGASATFNLTLTDTGMSLTTAAQNRNDYSFNSITDEKELIFEGTVAGGDEPYIGVRSYTATSGLDTRYGWLFAGMDSFNSSLTFDAQPNVGPVVIPSSNTGVCLLMFDDAQDYWFSVTGRRIIVVIKAVGGATTSYCTAYAGLLNPFGTASEVPYPFYLSGTTTSHNRAPDAGSLFCTGPTELFADTSTTSPAYFRRWSDGAWTRVQNSNNGAALDVNTVYPIGVTSLADSGAQNEDDIVVDGQIVFHCEADLISLDSGGVAVQAFMPSISDNEAILIPATVMSTPAGAADNDSNTVIRGELDNIYWVSATKSDGTVMSAEDTLDDGATRHIVFQNAHRTERYSYFALKAT